MFVDHTLIEVTQWCVRQIELFTPLTRKRLIVFLLEWLIIAALIAFLTHVVAGLFSYAPGRVVVSFIILLVMSRYFRKRKRELLSEPKHALPAAIWQRQGKRLIALGISLTVFLVFCSALVEAQEVQMSIFDWVCLIARPSPWILLAPIEYLLCTVSVPPAEKEKKRQERELHRFTPQGV